MKPFHYYSNKSPTWCNNISSLLSWLVYLQLNMIWAFSHPSSGAHDCSSSLWLYLRIVVRAVPRSWSGQLSPRYEGKTRGCYCSHELLMMGRRTPKTCWAVNKQVRIKNWKIVASGWWFIWIVRWCTDLQILKLKSFITVAKIHFVTFQQLLTWDLHPRLRPPLWKVQTGTVRIPDEKNRIRPQVAGRQNEQLDHDSTTMEVTMLSWHVLLHEFLHPGNTATLSPSPVTISCNV